MKGFFSSIKKVQTPTVQRATIEHSCASCPLKEQDCFKNDVEFTGLGNKKILILTGTMNIKQKSIERLAKELGRVDIDLNDDCLITSVIQSKNARHIKKISKNGKTEEKEVVDSELYLACCRQKVHSFIEKCHPVAILALGDRAMTSLVKHRSDFRGKFGIIDNWEGYCIPDQKFGSWIIPTWPINRLMELEDGKDGNGKVYLRHFRNSLKMLKEAVDSGYPEIRNDEARIETIINDDYAVKRINDCIEYAHNNPDHVVSFDYETTGLKPFLPAHKLICVSMAWDNVSIAFELNDKTIPAFKKFITDKKCMKTAHNIQFEELWTRVKLGTRVAHWKQDTQLDAHIIDNRTGNAGLKFQTYANFGVAGYDNEVDKYLEADYPNDLNKIHELPIKTVLKYCALDSLYGLMLAKKQDEEFARLAEINPMVYQARKLFKEGAIALCGMTENGMRISKDVLKNNKLEIQKRIAELHDLIMSDPEVKKWKKRMGVAFNLNSNQQLADTLFKHMGLEPVKITASGQPATDAKSLSEYSVPFLENKAEIKKLEKLMGTYVDGIEREAPDGVMHTFFPLSGPRTFRSSANSPNLQNIPKRWPYAKQIIRRCIFPSRAGCFFEADFSSLEVGIGACVTGDTMIETIDGKQSIIEVIKRVNNHEDVYVYGYDQDKCRIAVSKVTDGGITRKNAEVWRVTLDNGEVIDATPDHMFLLRSGEYCPLKELKPNTSLMPFYKTNVQSSYQTVYEVIYLNNGYKMKAHNLISEDVFNQPISSSGWVIHHKDHNGCNNSLSNILLCTREEHMRIHAIQGWENKPAGVRKSTWDGLTDEQKENFTQGFKRKWDSMSEEERKEYSLRVSERIRIFEDRSGKNNPMYGKRHTEESKEKNRQSHLGKKLDAPGWSKGLTKETDERVRRGAEAKIGRPTWNKGLKGVYSPTEETREKLRQAMTGRKFSDEAKEKLSVKAKERWKKVEMKSCPYCGQKMRVITNTHLARHGISIEEYKKTYNHKVVSIEYLGMQDVYNLNVEGIHNYAVGAGVVIKNCFHKDQNMLKYLAGHGDMHKDAALDAFLLHDNPELMTKPLRQGGKNGFVFPEFYGDYYGNCAVELWKNYVMKEKLADGTTVKSWMAKHGIKTFEQFNEHMREVENILWNVRFKDFGQWRKDVYEEYVRTGQYWNKTGFPYFGIMNRNDSTNYAIQGSAFHVNLYAMSELDKEIVRNKMKSYMCGEIHDAIDGVIHPDELNEFIPLLQTIMVDRCKEKFPWVIAPLSIEIDVAPLNKSWADMKTIDKRPEPCKCGAEYGYKGKPDEQGRIRWECPICEHFIYEETK